MSVKKAAVASKKAAAKKTPAKRTVTKRTAARKTRRNQQRGLTEAAITLLEKVDSGGIPMYVSDGLTRIAAENGVTVAGSDTPGKVIEALRKIHVRSID
jgi:hypothetical protein